MSRRCLVYSTDAEAQIRARCLAGWQTYARGRVTLNAIAGLRRSPTT